MWYILFPTNRTLQIGIVDFRANRHGWMFGEGVSSQQRQGQFIVVEELPNKVMNQESRPTDPLRSAVIATDKSTSLSVVIGISTWTTID